MSGPAAHRIAQGGFDPAQRWIRAGRRSSRAAWLLVATFLFVAASSGAVQFATGISKPAVQVLQWVGLWVFLAFALIEFGLGLVCWALFEAGEPLRRAWFFILLGSGFRLLGLAATAWTGGLAAAEAAPVRQVGVVALNPITAIFTAAGLWVVLQAHRRLGIARRPGPAETALIVLVTVAAVVLGHDATHAIMPAGSTRGGVFLFALVGPVLGVVLVEAVMLYRAAAAMGDGLVASCWASFVAGVLLAMGGQWVTLAVQRGGLPLFYSDVGSLMWLAAELGFVLAPAYQIEAVVRARSVLRTLRET